MTWEILASRWATGSPGSGEWRQYLCSRALSGGFEVAVCGFELDENGDETGDLIEDPDFTPVRLASLAPEHLRDALVALGWPSKHGAFPDTD